jgi:hypothetical protein
VQVAVTGIVRAQDARPLEGVHIATDDATTATDGDGHFALETDVPSLPADVNVDIRYAAAGLPVVDTSRLREATGAALDIGTITLPDPVGAEFPLTGGAGQSADGSVSIEGLPSGIDRFYARALDPDADADSFPGSFEELSTVPLNSAVFAWAEAVDAAGNPVDELPGPATMRVRIPRSQWVDLEDIRSGTDRIEVPFYTFDEQRDVWHQETPDGWLEDASRTVMPEDAEEVIRDGSFAGEIYAVLVVSHFSWMNVDYAYIGPWTLSRVTPTFRNNDCLFNAMQLAKTIALSAKGRTAYAKVNKPGADLGVELRDAQGPELATANLPKAYGQYEGESGGRKDQFKLRSAMWDKCGDGASADDKKQTTMILAATILHETAHWKEDNKKFPDSNANGGIEEGTQLERDLFGGSIGTSGGLNRDGNPVTPAQRDLWLDPAQWPPPPASPPRGAGAPRVVADPSPIQVTISTSKANFDLGEEIPVSVTYENVSAAPVRVLETTLLEGWPLRFDAVSSTTGEPARFLGPEIKPDLGADDYTTLGPGEQLMVTVPLLRDPDTGDPRYQLRSGAMSLTARYEAFGDVPETTSNALTLTLGAGAVIQGSVTSATTAAPMEGATVKAMRDDQLLATATSDAAGHYTMVELPAGAYTLEARAPGYLRSTREVIATTAAPTTANFSLSALLTAGELRIVLTWGAAPSDLDSHLWLPDDRRFHVYYGRRGLLDACPFAQLDQDDTNGFGPETITVAQRFPGRYVYAVRNFSGAPSLIASGAQVQLFDSSGLLTTITVPTVGFGGWWNVFSIDGNTITEVNALTEDPSPYPDSIEGCPPAALALAPSAASKP